MLASPRQPGKGARASFRRDGSNRSTLAAVFLALSRSKAEIRSGTAMKNGSSWDRMAYF